MKSSLIAVVFSVLVLSMASFTEASAQCSSCTRGTTVQRTTRTVAPVRHFFSRLFNRHG